MIPKDNRCSLMYISWSKLMKLSNTETQTTHCNSYCDHKKTHSKSDLESTSGPATTLQPIQLAANQRKMWGMQRRYAQLQWREAAVRCSQHAINVGDREAVSPRVSVGPGQGLVWRWARLFHNNISLSWESGRRGGKPLWSLLCRPHPNGITKPWAHSLARGVNSQPTNSVKLSFTTPHSSLDGVVWGWDMPGPVAAWCNTLLGWLTVE